MSVIGSSFYFGVNMRFLYYDLLFVLNFIVNSMLLINVIFSVFFILLNKLFFFNIILLFFVDLAKGVEYLLN